MPNEFTINFLPDNRLRVISPISVKTMVEDFQIIAEATDFNEFGFGKNLSEALADLQRAIVELYFTLEKEHERLSSDLENVWKALQEKIVRRI